MVSSLRRSRSRRARLALRPAVAALLLLGVTAMPASVGAQGKRVDQSKLQRLTASAADFELGVSAQRRGELDLAHSAYTAAIAKDPTFVEAMVNLARVCVALGSYSEAERWLIEANESRPEYPGILAARGLLALRRGYPTHAATELDNARKQMPDDPEVLINLGAALLRQGRASEAIATLDHAMRLDPSSTPAALNLGLAHDRSGDRQRAAYFYARFLTTATHEDPDRAAISGRLAELRGAGPISKTPVRTEPKETTVSPDVAANGGSNQ